MVHLGLGGDDPYLILDLPAEASDSQVKQAYRKLVRTHHPDALIARGCRLTYRLYNFGKPLVAAATDAGAELLTGGKRMDGSEFSKGHWFQPTVMSVDNNAMEIMQNEVFGHNSVPIEIAPAYAFDLDWPEDVAYGEYLVRTGAVTTPWLGQSNS